MFFYSFKREFLGIGFIGFFLINTYFYVEMLTKAFIK